MKHYALTMLLTSAGLLTACGSAGLVLNEALTGGSSLSDEHKDYAVQTDTASVNSASGFPNKPSLPDLLDFTAKTLDGNLFTASDFSAADVTIINIWSTTCAPCIREMPELASYAATLPENVQMMTWCLDAEFSPDADKISGFLADCGFDGITLVSGDGDLQALYNALTYTPTTIFVDSTGAMLSEPIIGAGNIEELYTAHLNEALSAIDMNKIA